MRGDSSTMKVLRPATAAEAVKAYARAKHAVPFAGGTDFMVGWNMGAFNGKTVLDLWNIAEWRQIRKMKYGLRIGALVTHAQLQAHPIARKEFPLLVQACATVGAAQIQNRGTIGGNIANASPAGDSFPPLAVYEAKIHVISKAGRRVVPFLHIFVGVKKTTLMPGELIEAVELPFLPRRPNRQMFRKIGQRAAQTISKTVAAAVLFLKKDGAVEDLRVAFGSVAPTVRRLKSVESVSHGRPLTPEVIEEVCALIDQDISPIDDIRSTREYRLRVSQNLLRFFLS